jgi:hypothetical protein
MTDKRFYMVMGIAVIALLIGLTGLAIGLARPLETTQSSILKDTGNKEFPTGSLPKDTQTSPDGSVNHTSPQQSGSVQQPTQ